MRFRRAVAAACAAAVAGIGLVSCSSGSEKAAGGDYRFVQVAPGVDEIKPPDRKPAPALSGPQVGSVPFDAASLKGQVVVVNFWASWCGPCRAEASGLESVYSQTKASGVRFVGVNVKDSKGAAASFLRDHNINYPSLFDDDGTLSAQWPVPVTLPSTVVIDRQGRIAARFRAAILASDLLPVVQRIANESPQQA